MRNIRMLVIAVVLMRYMKRPSLNKIGRSFRNISWTMRGNKPGG